MTTTCEECARLNCMVKIKTGTAREEVKAQLAAHIAAAHPNPGIAGGLWPKQEVIVVSKFVRTERG